MADKNYIFGKLYFSIHVCNTRFCYIAYFLHVLKVHPQGPVIIATAHGSESYKRHSHAKFLCTALRNV